LGWVKGVLEEYRQVVECVEAYLVPKLLWIEALVLLKIYYHTSGLA